MISLIFQKVSVQFYSWFELPWRELGSSNLWNFIALHFSRVLWRSFPWHMEWHRCCNQGFPRARFNCWKHGRFLQWDIHSQVFCDDLLFVSNFYVTSNIYWFQSLVFVFRSLSSSRLRHPNGTLQPLVIYIVIWLFTNCYCALLFLEWKYMQRNLKLCIIILSNFCSY